MAAGRRFGRPNRKARVPFRLAFWPTVPQNHPRASARGAGGGMVDFQAARRAMVDSQIRVNDVTDFDLIDAMLEIPREAFVPERLSALAYLDRDLALPSSKGIERFLVKPELTAKLIQAAGIESSDRVLVIGSATGYSAAVISCLAAAVVALEEAPALVDVAEATVRRLGFAKVTPATGPLAGGWPAGAPFDVILTEGGVEAIPDALFAQLAEGGRLVTVVYDGAGMGLGEAALVSRVGKATLFRSVRGEVGGRVLFDASAPLLPGFGKAPAFVF
jgi:protein-L-isoaspartate(D-aspartate) O-methyltransferase